MLLCKASKLLALSMLALKNAAERHDPAGKVWWRNMRNVNDLNVYKRLDSVIVVLEDGLPTVIVNGASVVYRDEDESEY